MITIRCHALGFRLAVQLQPKAATFGFAREGVSLTGLAASGSKQKPPPLGPFFATDPGLGSSGNRSGPRYISDLNAK